VSSNSDPRSHPTEVAVQPKNRLRDGVPLVKFRGETGALIPVVRCKDHDKEKAHKKLLSMCDVDEESGQV
jgi:hypothetical protein